MGRPNGKVGLESGLKYRKCEGPQSLKHELNDSDNEKGKGRGSILAGRVVPRTHGRETVRV